MENPRFLCVLLHELWFSVFHALFFGVVEAFLCLKRRCLCVVCCLNIHSSAVSGIIAYVFL